MDRHLGSLKIVHTHCVKFGQVEAQDVWKSFGVVMALHYTGGSRCCAFKIRWIIPWARQNKNATPERAKLYQRILLLQYMHDPLRKCWATKLLSSSSSLATRNSRIRAKCQALSLFFLLIFPVNRVYMYLWLTADINIKQSWYFQTTMPEIRPFTGIRSKARAT